MSFLDRFSVYPPFDPAGYVPLVVDGATVGFLKSDLVDALCAFPQVFAREVDGLTLNAGLTEVPERTSAVAEVLAALREEGHFPHWRDELFPVAASFAAPPAFNIERGAVPKFGVRAYGVHLNGYVRDGGRMLMWVARRSPTKDLDPGKLDQIVAGGQPVGLSLRDNLIKECAEEAAIPAELTGGAVGVSAVSYQVERPEGVRRDVEFIFDLELPAEFVPRNDDGEVAGFELLPIEEIAEIARDTDTFKFNCSLVAIDFLIRHGIIAPDHPDYLTLLKALRR